MQRRHDGRPVSPEGTESLGRIAVSLLPATFIVQLCSFAASLALAWVLGATYATDAYFLGLSAPLLVSGALLAGLRLGAIPSLTQVDRSAPTRFSQAASELFTAVIVASFGLAIIATFLSILLIPIFVSERDDQTVALARLLTVELAPLGVLGACSGALGAILAVRGHFVAPVAFLSFDPAFRTLFVFVTGSEFGVQALAMGHLAGNVLAVGLLWRLVRKAGVDLRILAFYRSRFVLGVLGFSAPLFVGQTVLQLNPVIDRAMAASLAPGSVTVLDLAVGMFTVPVALIASSFIAPIAATWAARYAENGWPALRQSHARAARGLLVLVPPIALLGFLLRRELLTLTYDWGAFSERSAERTALAFGMLLLGLPAQTLVITLSTLFVVRRDSIFPMKIAFANVALNLALNLVLRPSLGVAGLALSTTLTYTILCGVYAVEARRRFGPLALASMRLQAGAALAALSLAAATAWFLLSVLPIAESKIQALLSVVVVGGAGATVYIAMFAIFTKSHVVVATLRRLSPGNRGR